MIAVKHLLSSSGFYGAEAVVLELCQGQIQSGVSASVTLFRSTATNTDDLYSRFNDAGVPVDVLDIGGRLDFGAARRLRSMLKEEPVQILHSHKYKTTPYALFAARTSDSKVVATFHNWLHETPLLSLYARVDKFLASYCDACVAVSKPVADELSRYVQAKEISLVRNGVDTAHWKRAVRACGDSHLNPFVVGFVGRISSQKGASDLLDAIESIPEINGRPVHGLFVGDGELAEELKSRSTGTGLSGRVLFTGVLTDVRDAYQQMDLIALPSRNEGFPMILLEAMAMEIPAIANDVGDVSGLIKDCSTGRLLHEFGPAVLADAIRDLLSDDQRRKAMGATARALVCTEFSTEAMVDAYQRVYSRALNQTT